MPIAATTEGGNRLTLRTSPRKQVHVQEKEVSNPEGRRIVLYAIVCQI